MISKRSSSPKTAVRKASNKNATVGSPALQKAAYTIDDVIWALQSVKLDALRDVASLLHTTASESTGARLGQAERRLGQTPNLTYLIGVLPGLFQDRNLFPQNEDISDFAASVLGLEMNRDAKRSRYEIIGRVVCETVQLKDDGLSQLVSALEAMIGDKKKLAEMAKRRESANFSWNLAIQEMFKKG